ncbi:BLUF domain-containing protein [Stenotrophomonas cyclobalanopsidis]|uniref:BLUF domain-containing protein n=1 Tax=Stenotrophomonas cyclobalanopsidis TaxID=2771362 RepID=A0ABQ6SX94_9GAMM|nr:BLUF domain-containing protein [Stenotrophomonas cyclobalanopsidis]
MPFRAIGYMSQARQPWNREDLDALVQRAATFNLQAGVTGVLLFDGVSFLQYIEGPGDGVDLAYRRILSSAFHSEIVELGRGTVGSRLLPYWSMHWLLADPSQLRSVARADWTGFVRSTRPSSRRSTAMDRLHVYLHPYLARPQ